MPRKIGPNFEDENRIKEWLAAGASVPEISGYLNIAEEGVQIFVDSLEAKAEKKPKQTRRKKAEPVAEGEEATEPEE